MQTYSPPLRKEKNFMGKKNLYKYCCTESEVEVVVHVEGKWRGTGFF